MSDASCTACAMGICPMHHDSGERRLRAENATLRAERDEARDGNERQTEITGDLRRMLDDARAETATAFRLADEHHREAIEQRSRAAAAEAKVAELEVERVEWMHNSAETMARAEKAEAALADMTAERDAERTRTDARPDISREDAQMLWTLVEALPLEEYETPRVRHIRAVLDAHAREEG